MMFARGAKLLVFAVYNFEDGRDLYEEALGPLVKIGVPSVPSWSLEMPIVVAP